MATKPNIPIDLLLLAGCIAMVLGAALAGWNMMRISQLSHGHGYIADVEEIYGSPREWRVRIVFYSATEHRYSFMTIWQSSGKHPRSPAVDRELNILYDPADPQRTAEIDNPTERWAGPVIFFVIGVISFGVRYARSAKEISEA